MNLLADKEASILVVDDEPVTRALCCQALKGFRIVQAENGEEAMALLAEQEVDLVLSDVIMPYMSGLELLRALKERKPDQTVIIMTGLGDREVVLNALRAGADDFISKPIHMLQLQTTVAKVLQKRRLKEELLRLKHLDRLKSEFLGLISHKLNTPITAISLFMQNLALGISDPQDADFQQTLAMVLRESDYLGGLVQDLLHFSEFILKDAPLQREWLDLKDLARTVLFEKGGMAAAKNVRVIDTLPPFPLLPLDRRRLMFSIEALLDNAIKFTACGGEVRLQGVVNDASLQLIVADNGRGIPAAEMNKVFEKFYQVDPDHTGQVRGFGLGLFYARQFMQDHGGQLQLQNAPAGGIQAIMTLPRPNPAPS